MKIVCIADKKNRIQYNRMKLLSKYFKNLDIDVFAMKDSFNIDKYDVAYYTHFSIYKKRPFKGKKYASITSHKCLSNKKKTLSQLSVFDGISVNNTFLFDEFKDYIDNLYYTPNGVDTNFFSFRNKELGKPITLGWVGNKDRETKNYRKMLKPLIHKFKTINFNVVASSKKDTDKQMKNIDEMKQFYYSIDFLLVTSTDEGTPNPALEAMSCGVPVITTPVGNMVEIVLDGISGFVVENDFESFSDSIRWVKKNFNNEKYSKMRQSSRFLIEDWSWENKHLRWLNFFEDFGK